MTTAGDPPNGLRWHVRVVAWLVALLALGALAYAFRPVCVPIPAEDVAHATVPLAQRTDRDFYLKVFQRRHGTWYQCKTWISRQLFF